VILFKNKKINNYEFEFLLKRINKKFEKYLKLRYNCKCVKILKEISCLVVRRKDKMKLFFKSLKISNKSNNPIFQAEEHLKRSYFEILKFFVGKYNRNDYFSMEYLKLLRSELTNKRIRVKRNFSKLEIKDKINKLHKYQNYLLCDIYCICMLTNYKFELAKDLHFYFRENKLENFKKYCLDTKSIEKKDLNKFKNSKEYVEEFIRNKEYIVKKEKRILLTATMSAGKSTLINALIGKKVSKVTNEACTAKIHYFYDKPFEDNKNYKYDKSLNLNATENELLENNIKNRKKNIYVSTYFRMLKNDDYSYCLIDTPGVNSSLRSNDKSITEKKIKEEDYDILLYVLNAENMSSTDNFNHLNYILQNKKSNNIIFVINKLDSFRKGEDSIEDSIKNVKKELLKVGFENPIICPISAHAGFLAKQHLYSGIQDEDMLDELLELERKFKKEYWNLSKYYDNNITELQNNKYETLLINSGIRLLEQKILEM
jgi:ferrous iron transport protein B